MIFIIFGRLTEHLQKNKRHKLIIIGFWLIAVDWYINVGLDLGPSPPNHHAKYLLRILPMTIPFLWPSFVTKWFIIRNIYLKCILSANIHYCVRTFEVDCLKNRMWLFCEIIKFINCAIKTTFSNVFINLKKKLLKVVGSLVKPSPGLDGPSLLT